MRIIAAIFALCFVSLLIYSSFSPACSSVSSVSPPADTKKPQEKAEARQEPKKEIEKPEPPADGLSGLISIFSPLHGGMKNIYGNGLIMGGQYCLNISKTVDFLISIGFMSKSGDPYYDDLTFTSEESSTLLLTPLEFSVRRRIALMKSPSRLLSRGLYAGAGINYIMASEKIPGILSAKGSGFGTHVFAGPQIFFRENAAFEGEVKLLMNEVDMKYDGNRYSIALSGVVIKAGVSWYY